MTTKTLQQRILSRNVEMLARHLPRTGIIQVRQPVYSNTSFDRSIVLYSYEGKYAISSQSSIVPLNDGGSITIYEKLLFLPDTMDLDLAEPNLYLFIFDTNEDSLNHFPLANRIIDIDSTEAPGASLVTLERTDEAVPRTLVTRIIEDIEQSTNPIVPSTDLVTLATPVIYIDIVLGSSTTFSCSPVSGAATYQWRYKQSTVDIWSYDATQNQRVFIVSGTTPSAKYTIECRACDSTNFQATGANFSKWASYTFLGSIAKILSDPTPGPVRVSSGFTGRSNPITRTYVQAVRRRDGYFVNVPPPKPREIPYVTHLVPLPVRLPVEPLVYYNQAKREWSGHVWYGVDNIGYPPITHFQYQLKYGPPGQEFYGNIHETIGYEDFTADIPNLPRNREVARIRGKFYIPEATISPQDELELYHEAFGKDYSRIEEFSDPTPTHSLIYGNGKYPDEVGYVDILFNRNGLWTDRQIMNEALYTVFARENPEATRADIRKLNKLAEDGTSGGHAAALATLAGLQEDAEALVPEYRRVAYDRARYQIYGTGGGGGSDGRLIVGGGQNQQRAEIALEQYRWGVGVFGRNALPKVEIWDFDRIGSGLSAVNWWTPHRPEKALAWAAAAYEGRVPYTFPDIPEWHNRAVATILGEPWDPQRFGLPTPVGHLSELGFVKSYPSDINRAVMRPSLTPRPIMGYYPHYSARFATGNALVSFILDNYNSPDDMSETEMEFLRPTINGVRRYYSNQVDGPGDGDPDVGQYKIPHSSKYGYYYNGVKRMGWISHGEVEMREHSVPIRGRDERTGRWLVGMLLPGQSYTGVRQGDTRLFSYGRPPLVPRDPNATTTQHESMVTLLFCRNTVQKPGPDTPPPVTMQEKYEHYRAGRLGGSKTTGPLVPWEDSLLLPAGVKTRDDFNKAMDRFDEFLIAAAAPAIIHPSFYGARLLDKGGVGRPDPVDGSSVSMTPRYFSEHGGVTKGSLHPDDWRTGDLEGLDGNPYPEGGQNPELADLYYVFTKYDKEGGILARTVRRLIDYFQTKLIDGGLVNLEKAREEAAIHGFHNAPPADDDDMNAISFYPYPGFPEDDIFLLTEDELGDDGIECELIIFEGDPNFTDQPYLPIELLVWSVNAVGRSLVPTSVVGPTSFSG